MAEPRDEKAYTFPRGVTDPFCPSEHVITESTERRLLWHIETELAVGARMGSSLDRLGRALRRYLNETCEHHWHDEPEGWYGGQIPPFRQCLWCNVVEPLSENPTPPGHPTSPEAAS